MEQAKKKLKRKEKLKTKNWMSWVWILGVWLGLIGAVEGGGGRTYFHGAAAKGHLDLVKYFVEKGESIDMQNERGETPLHMAAGKGRVKVIQYLLDQGANVNIEDCDGNKPLDHAAMNGYIESAKRLLDRGSEVDLEGRYGWTRLHLAVWDRDEGGVRRILEEGADVNMKNGKGRTALHWSVWRGWKDGMKILLDMGAEIDSQDERGMTSLYLASWKENWEIVEELLSRGGNIMLKNKNGRTALHKAVMQGNVIVVKVMLQVMKDRGLGAEGFNMVFQDTDNQGETPILMAVQRGDLEMFKELMNYYQMLDEKTKASLERMARILDLAKVIQSGDIGLIIARLAEMGVQLDIDIQEGNYGLTMLHFASSAGHLEMVKKFVELGADMRIKDKRGMTAKDMARAAGHREIYEYLDREELGMNEKKYGGKKTKLRGLNY